MEKKSLEWGRSGTTTGMALHEADLDLIPSIIVSRVLPGVTLEYHWVYSFKKKIQGWSGFKVHALYQYALLFIGHTLVLRTL